MKIKTLLLLPCLPMAAFGQQLEKNAPGLSAPNVEVARILSGIQEKNLSININAASVNDPLQLSDLEYSVHPEILHEGQIAPESKKNYSLKENLVSNIKLKVNGRFIDGTISCNSLVESFDVVSNKNILFNYVNTYFVFKDENNNVIATESYIERNAGFLKQTFKIEKSSLTPVISSITAYPNPANKRINVSYDVDVAGQYSLYIVNIKGVIVKKVFEEKLLAQRNYNEAVDLDLLDGNYTIVLQSGNQKTTNKLTIKN